MACPPSASKASPSMWPTAISPPKPASSSLPTRPHEQYTRNMVTAASSADAAVVLVDATKLDWQAPLPELLPQTRRHSLLVNLLRVPSIIFAVNKLDAVEDPTVAFNNIQGALEAFTLAARIDVRATIPISALKGHNVVEAQP